VHPTKAAAIGSSKDTRTAEELQAFVGNPEMKVRGHHLTWPHRRRTACVEKTSMLASTKTRNPAASR